MTAEPKLAALAVFLFFFGLVTMLGFAASRWRAGNLAQLDEWALGGRKFGTLIAWFLIGGDLYTAYTIVAVPALVWGTGAAGFFALSYTVMVYPLMYLIMPRLWSVARRHGHVTAADFVAARYGSRLLTLAIAATGILATMPYIALQLIGIQVVLDAMGLEAIGFGGTGFRHELPLIAAFLVLALYTYRAGLRAPALIALVKDLMIFVMMGAAVIVIPAALGGYGAVFRAAGSGLAHRVPARALILPSSGFSAYATLALGSAMALMVYPHSVTGILSSGGPRVIRRNAALLPAYSLILGLVALMGYMAIAAGIRPASPNAVVPLLILKMFPEWFAGFCFAAIAIGALVPAAIMSIAAANLFTRNIYHLIRPERRTSESETSMAKLVSLLVKLGALIFILAVPTEYAIELQLLGGVWILQTFPAVAIGLYGRWFHRHALLAGWIAGMAAGTAMVGGSGWKPVYALVVAGVSVPAYAAIYALAINLAVAGLATAALGRGPASLDRTRPEDYRDAVQSSKHAARV